MAQVPLYFKPRPYQKDAWQRRLSGQYDYYVNIWHRQAGKDTDFIQYALLRGYLSPGTQSAYVGLDNKWVRRNIWDKYVDGRTHFANYPEDVLTTNTTQQQAKFHNNPEDKAEALIQFIGFKESESLIGSSYDNFYISELSLYKRGAFDFIQPIWDNKIAEGLPLSVNFNFTPRGMSNGAADWMKALTGTDDPVEWPGEHGRVYVDWLPADRSEKEPGVRLYTDEHLEDIRQRYIRLYGNDQLFRQEMMCEFLAVNAGLVYPTIEALRQENRFTPFNINTAKPLYMAWDISSKGKSTDWTSCIVFQYYDGMFRIYDCFEINRVAVVEAVQELSKKPYFHLIRAAALPWDADRSGSRNSPLEECRQMFPNISWFKLDRSYVSDGIAAVRKLIPNMLINSTNCEWLIECFENYEYKTIASLDDFAGEPKHDRYSHMMDAVRYCADFINQNPYIMQNDGRIQKMPERYGAWYLDEDVEDEWMDLPPGMRPSKFSKLRNKRPNDLYGNTLRIKDEF